MNKKSPYCVTKEMIESKIISKQFQIINDGKMTICNILLQNGFTVSGESACVDALNYVKEIAERIAYERAFEKIWILEGYLMQEKKYKESLKNK